MDKIKSVLVLVGLAVVSFITYLFHKRGRELKEIQLELLTKSYKKKIDKLKESHESISNKTSEASRDYYTALNQYDAIKRRNNIKRKKSGIKSK